MSKKPKTTQIIAHEKRLRDLGCIITGKPYPQLHHCKGGSMKSYRVGMGQKQNPWLQIPLHIELHTADKGIHQIGVKTWESKFGTQESMLNKVSELLGYDVWERAGDEITGGVK